MAASSADLRLALGMLAADRDWPLASAPSGEPQASAPSGEPQASSSLSETDGPGQCSATLRHTISGNGAASSFSPLGDTAVPICNGSPGAYWNRQPERR
jgi:hypothetical protein